MARSTDAGAVAVSLVQGHRDYVDRFVAQNGGSEVAVKPSHRVKFHWPPHPVSYSYHVLASDWTGRASLTAYGDEFEVRVARTPNGVFGRVPELWHEDRGQDEEEMLANLRHSLEPLFQRQLAVNRTLGHCGRFTGHIRELPPLELVELLYCEDRDVANEARTEIETRASTGLFLPVLLSVLGDRRHPYRRSAQWCVLDLFEDLPCFCHTDEEAAAATTAIKGLIWDAEDDYARTIYKAGAVLGGHVPNRHGEPALIECLHAPSKIGRRSAIHGLFHVVEWTPDARARIVEALNDVAENDPEPVLRDYAHLMVKDLAAHAFDHTPDVVFVGE